MELLKQRILKDGIEIGTEVVKVDSFLNHQLDIGLFMALGKEIHRRFGHLGINKNPDHRSVRHRHRCHHRHLF